MSSSGWVPLKISLLPIPNALMKLLFPPAFAPKMAAVLRTFEPFTGSTLWLSSLLPLEGCKLNVTLSLNERKFSISNCNNMICRNKWRKSHLFICLQNYIFFSINQTFPADYFIKGSRKEKKSQIKPLFVLLIRKESLSLHPVIKLVTTQSLLAELGGTGRRRLWIL